MGKIQIKSSKYGISVILDPDMPFRELCIAVCEKFAECSNFLGAASVKISFEGRLLSSDEINKLVECIEANSQIYISYIEEHNELKDRDTLNAINRLNNSAVMENAKIVIGPVFSDQFIESNQGLVVLGDVKDGATVRAAGNIIVTGALKGKAVAGYPNNRNAYIYAGDYETNVFRIGDLSREIEKPGKKLFGKDKASPVSFSIFDGELTCEPFERGAIKHLEEQ